MLCFVPLAGVALLILHTLKVRGTLVDTTTLRILALLLLVPLPPYVTRLQGRGSSRLKSVAVKLGSSRAAAAELPPGPAPADLAPSDAPNCSRAHIARSSARTGKAKD